MLSETAWDLGLAWVFEGRVSVERCSVGKKKVRVFPEYFAPCLGPWPEPEPVEASRVVSLSRKNGEIKKDDLAADKSVTE